MPGGDRFEIKLPPVSQTINLTVSGEDQLKSTIRTVKKELDGVSLHDFYKSEEGLLADVTNYLREFKREASSFNAENLVKSINALKALTGRDISDFLPDASDIEDIGRAFNSVSREIKESFSVGVFRDALIAFGKMREEGIDIADTFRQIAGNDQKIHELTDRVIELEGALERSEQAAEEARESLRNYTDDNGIGDLERAAEQLAELRGQAVREFRAFLTANNIDASQFTSFGRFSEYYDAITEGNMTAGQAIAKFKSELSELLPQGATTGLDILLQKIEEIANSLANVSAQIRDVSSRPMENFPAEELADDTERDAEAIRQRNEAINAFVQQRSALGDMTQVFTALIEAIRNAGEGATDFQSEITPVITSLQELSNIDAGKLQSIGRIFEGLSQINGFKISSKQAQNLHDFIAQLQGVGDLSAVRTISGLSLAGFSNLSIRKASLENLAVYLPQIANVNVDNLERLQHIDLSNFSKLTFPNIDTEAISGLGKLGDALDQVRDSADALSKTIGAAGTSTARSLHQMSGAGLSHEEILGRLQSGIGHTGASRARTAAMKLGFTNEDAKELAETLEHTYALIDDIKVHWKDFDDGVRTVDWVEVQGKSEEGIDIKERLRYLQAVNEEGKKYWKIQREGLDHYKAAKEDSGLDASKYEEYKKGIEAVEKAEERRQEALRKQEEDSARTAEKQIADEKQKQEASKMTAEQAEAELTKLKSLRIDYQNQIDKASELGIDNETVDRLRDEVSGIDNMIPVLENIASEQSDMTIGMDDYKDAIKRAKDELVLLRKQLSVDIKESGAFIPMNDNQRDTALKTIDARRKEAQQQVDRAAGLGLSNTGAVDTLRNDLIPLYGELEKKVKDGAISQKDYNETMRKLSAIAGNVNTELKPEIKTMSELDTQYQKLAESMRETQDNARNGVSGAWVDATDAQKTSLDNLIARQNALGEAWKNGTLTSEQLGNEVGQITEEYNNLADAVNREYQARNKAHKDTLDEMNARRGLNQEINNAAKLLRDYSAAERSRNQSSRDAYKAIQENIKGMNELAARYERGEIDLKTLQEEQRRYSNEIANNSRIIRQNGDDHMTAFGKIGRAIKTHLTTLTATASIGSIMRYIRQMVEAVREIDTAMTELRKVTDETDARYEQFLDNAATRAKNLSATISDTVSATADFARLGLSIDEAEKAADAAIVYKAVGDDIASIGDAAESIISTMKAFGVEASDAMSIVDKFNKVGKELCPAA